MFIHEITIEFIWLHHALSLLYIVGDTACVYCMGEALTPTLHRLTCVRIHNCSLQSFKFHYTIDVLHSVCSIILTNTKNRYYRQIFPDNSFKCKKNLLINQKKCALQLFHSTFVIICWFFKWRKWITKGVRSSDDAIVGFAIISNYK